MKIKTDFNYFKKYIIVVILVIIAFLSGVMSNRPFISNPTVGIENGNTNINNSNVE